MRFSMAQRVKSEFALATTMRSKPSEISNNQQKKRKLRNLKSRMKKLRGEMKEIGAEQRKIKEGQIVVREKFEAIELECQQLRRETTLIAQQSVSTQIRLALMFQILKARENHDFSKASLLTSALRELVARENLQK